MDPLGTPLTGTCAFRLMPHDDLADAPSTAHVTPLGAGLALTYTWTHPSDGAQRGGLVIGAPDDEGRLEAAWFDSWHQQPALMTLPGRRDGDRIELSGTYLEEWGWTITLDLSSDGATMTMCNVVPASALSQLPPDAPPTEAGPYDVMVARWLPAS
ncbi:MAG: hypothetical protein Q4F65_14280 [Propionibacteriaceae bacterium]|nr:hypothetical protein [Propionibacteriaceae bacterium]